MNLEKARFNMVEQQVRPWDVLDPEVLETMTRIHREDFAGAGFRNLANSEAHIPILDGQTMLSPVIEGKILQALALKKTDEVLEIGTGSGYFAALLADQAQWVRSIEINIRIADIAARHLDAAGINNVIVQDGDGINGWPERAPYDVIVFSGGLHRLPDDIVQQLKPGGRLFAFVGEAPIMRAKLLQKQADGRLRNEDLFESLVPMLQNAPAVGQFEF